MCTADTAHSVFFNSDAKKTRRPSTAVRFAMKLPRYVVAATQQRQEDTSAARLPVADADANGTPLRRCQSAQTPARLRPRGIMAGMREHPMHKSRSRSQGPNNTNNRSKERTRELPIPCPSCGDEGHGRPEWQQPTLARSVDKNDLARMYDYATWSMYERIVGARRRRSTLAPQGHIPCDSDAGGGASATPAAAAAVADAAKRQPSRRPSTQYDSSSTATTADETDKSSTTSSSWSRVDSPMMYAGQQQQASLHPGQSSGSRGGSSGPSPRESRAACCSCDMTNDEDSFIFQLDM